MTYFKHIRKSAANFLAAVAIFLLVVALFAGVFFWQGRKGAKVSAEREYYFLVRDCEDTTASAVAGQVYLAGGAGYLYESGGGSCVVLAGYFRLGDAERVKSTMEEREIVTRIVTLSAHDFSLSGGAEEYAKRVEGNLTTAETCARILFDTANGLERTSLTQEEGRAAVRGVVTSLKGLREGNSEALFSGWNADLAAAEHRGAEIAEGILFAKDLRYLQIQLLMAVLSAESRFA